MMPLSNQIAAWLREQLAAAGVDGFVFGLSGGVDSAAAAALAVRAIGPNRVLAPSTDDQPLLPGPIA
jgi:NH3-dependent NAD+ synthetase